MSEPQAAPEAGRDVSALSTRATDMLACKTLARVTLGRPNELQLAFTDGTRLFVDASTDLELSIA